MEKALVTTITWQEIDGNYHCNLILYDDHYWRLLLKPETHISFKVLDGRHCIGYRELIQRATEKEQSRHTSSYKPCPSENELKKGKRCKHCTRSDITLNCLYCSGEDCETASLEIKRECLESTGYVYLASFGGKIKAGISKEERVMKRWIEQGADLTMRVLKGNGREVRRLEKRIQDELGALRMVRTSQKLNLDNPENNIKKEIRLLKNFQEKVHELIPRKYHFKEDPQILLPRYRLPKLDKKPIHKKVHQGAKVSGKILAVKGPILLLKEHEMPFTLNLHNLIARKIEMGAPLDISSQTSLDRFY